MTDGKILPVGQVLQCPELPNGCEITSLCEALRYYGFDADKCDLADNYLPRSDRWYGADPDIEYMGDPHFDDDSEQSGYYCFPGAVITAAERYLEKYDKNAGYEAVDLTGTPPEDLPAFIDRGIPVIIWASLRFEDIAPDENKSYDMLGGRRHEMYHGLHCMVLKGYDSDYRYLADPLDLNHRVEKSRFESVYRQMLCRACAIVRKENKHS